MKKLVKVAVAIMLVLTMTVSVCAAYNGSVQQEQVPVYNVGSATVNGKTVPVSSWELSIVPAAIASVSDGAFKAAYDEIKNAKDLTALVSGLSDQLPAGVSAEDLAVRDVFDVKYLGTTKWQTIDITFRPAGVTGNDTVIVLHKGANGWEVVPSSVYWNGEVTATFTSLSPVAIVTLRTTGVNPNGPTSPATGDINVLACGVVAAAALLV